LAIKLSTNRQLNGEQIMKIYFVYATFKNLKEAKSFGNKLVQNKLAACTNIIPEIYSLYM
tara:strand:- start:97 stop:276 length:180 start_codon:yes stop_codon:yes gene_type:complete